jgi:hypothetical protein
MSLAAEKESLTTRLDQSTGDTTMPRTTSCLTLFTLVLVSSPLIAADAAREFFFRKGDRIVFLGDSITIPFCFP